MPFFTRKGDQGQGGLLGGKRLRKDALEFEVLGTIDELSAFIGFAFSICKNPILNQKLRVIQVDLNRIMAEIAGLHAAKPAKEAIQSTDINKLEEWISSYEQQLEVPQGFTFPGDNQGEAALDICRAIARRAERRLVSLRSQNPGVNIAIQKYLNRLSSLLYILRIWQSQSDIPSD